MEAVKNLINIDVDDVLNAGGNFHSLVLTGKGRCVTEIDVCAGGNQVKLFDGDRFANTKGDLLHIFKEVKGRLEDDYRKRYQQTSLNYISNVKSSHLEDVVVNVFNRYTIQGIIDDYAKRGVDLNDGGTLDALTQLKQSRACHGVEFDLFQYYVELGGAVVEVKPERSASSVKGIGNYLDVSTLRSALSHSEPVTILKAFLHQNSIEEVRDLFRLGLYEIMTTFDKTNIHIEPLIDSLVSNLKNRAEAEVVKYINTTRNLRTENISLNYITDVELEELEKSKYADSMSFKNLASICRTIKFNAFEFDYIIKTID